MKKLSMLFAALLLVGGATFTSCGDDDPKPGPTPNQLKLTDANGTELTQVELPADGSQQVKVYVQADGAAWTMALGEQDWCEAVKGETRITLSADPNQTGEARSTTLTVTAGEKSASLTVNQPAAAQLFLGTYEDYAGTYTLGYIMSDGSTFDIVFTIATSNNTIAYPIDAQGGTTEMKSYTISGWSYSEVGKLKPMRAVFLPGNDDPNYGILELLCEAVGNVTVDGTAYSGVEIAAVSAANATGSRTIWTALEGQFFGAVLGAFIDQQMSGLYLEGEVIQDGKAAETVAYIYSDGQSAKLINDKDLFPVSGAVAEPGNAPAGVMSLKSGMTLQKLNMIPSFTRFPVKANVSTLRVK